MMSFLMNFVMPITAVFLTFYLVRTYVYYPHSAVIKEITGTNRITTFTRWRISRQNGREKWILLGGEELPTCTNPDVIELKSNGRKVLTAYLKRGQYFYQEDKTTSQLLQAIKPFTENQRTNYIDQLKRAETEKGFNWKENIPMLAGMTGLIILAVVGYMIFSEWQTYSLEVRNMDINRENRFIDALDKFAESKDDITVIKNAVAPNKLAWGVPN